MKVRPLTLGKMNLMLGIAAIGLAATTNASEFAVLYTQQVNNNDNIILALPDGERRTVTDHRRKDSSPEISPDGRHIVFASERVGWWKVWKMDLRDGSFTQLTNSSSAEYAPTWSPLGDRIAFVSSRDGDADIYVMNSDGSNLRNISDNNVADATPYWHSDDRIYYSSDVSGTLQIVSDTVEGNDLKLHSTDGIDKLMPQVSPSGDEILFYADVDGNSDVYALSTRGAGTRRLTTDPLLDIRARWSPDGEQIVFERGDKRRNQHIFVMDKDGGNQRQLTTRGYNYSASFVGNCEYLCGESANYE